MRLSLFLFSLLLSSLSWALEVHWGKPQMSYSERKGWTQVTLVGEVPTETELSFSQDDIIVIRNNEFRKLSADKIYGSKASALSNEAGEISWKLLIPYGQVQLPLKLTRGEEVEYINLGLVIPELSPPPVQAQVEEVPPKREEVIKPEEPPQASVWERAGEWSREVWNTESSDPQASSMWLGLGYTQNYLVQDSTSFGRELDFYSYYIPSIFLEYQHQLSNRWNMGAYYLHLPGQATSSSDLDVSPKDYAKSLLGITTDYFLYPSYRSLSVGLQWNWSVRSEIQYLNIPFPERREADASQIKIGSASLGLVSVGPRFMLFHNKRWTYEFDVQYQFLAMPDAKAEFSSILAYRYGLGISRGIANWKFGLFHSSQVFNADYVIESPGLKASGASDTSDDGQLETKHTLLELRLGYSF